MCHRVNGRAHLDNRFVRQEAKVFDDLEHLLGPQPGEEIQSRREKDDRLLQGKSL